MEQSSWQTNRLLASQAIPHILWRPNVHYCAYWNPPRAHVLSQINPVHAPHHTFWGSIFILSSHLSLCLLSGLFPSGFPTKTLYETLFSPLCAVYPAHLVLLDLIIRIISGAEYRSLTSLLCSFLHSPVTWSLLGPNILLSSLFSNTLIFRSSINVSDQVKQQAKL